MEVFRNRLEGSEQISEPDPRIGMPVSELDTPTLLLERAASDRNLSRMASFFEDRPANLRPHFKNHKCVTLAKRQLAAVAIGMTCAKLGEAEVLVQHGFSDVLVANQVVGPARIKRLAQLAGRARVAVAIDRWEHASAVSRAAVTEGATVDLFVEVDIGMQRCGVPPGAPAVKLVRRVTELSGVRFAGCRRLKGIWSTYSIAPNGQNDPKRPCNWRSILAKC